MGVRRGRDGGLAKISEGDRGAYGSFWGGHARGAEVKFQHKIGDRLDTVHGKGSVVGKGNWRDMIERQKDKASASLVVAHLRSRYGNNWRMVYEFYVIELDKPLKRQRQKTVYVVTVELEGIKGAL